MKEKHETCIKILAAIEYYESQISNAEKDLKRITPILPLLKPNIDRRVEIYHKCIKRLEKRYKRALNELYREYSKKELEKLKYLVTH